MASASTAASCGSRNRTAVTQKLPCYSSYRAEIVSLVSSSWCWLSVLFDAGCSVLLASENKNVLLSVEFVSDDDEQWECHLLSSLLTSLFEWMPMEDEIRRREEVADGSQDADCSRLSRRKWSKLDCMTQSSLGTNAFTSIGACTLI
jgi:hypothetical protein